jgi:hypothetical protein
MSYCTEHSDCAAYLRALVLKWYPSGAIVTRRTREEVALDRDKKRRAIAARREFNARRRMEKAKKKEADLAKSKNRGDGVGVHTVREPLDFPASCGAETEGVPEVHERALG